MTRQRGFYKRYALTHVDGTPVSPRGVYFVLKLNSKDPQHAWASCEAALAYAAALERGSKLAEDLRVLVRKQLDQLEKKMHLER